MWSFYVADLGFLTARRPQENWMLLWRLRAPSRQMSQGLREKQHHLFWSSLGGHALSVPSYSLGHEQITHFPKFKGRGIRLHLTMGSGKVLEQGWQIMTLGTNQAHLSKAAMFVHLHIVSGFATMSKLSVWDRDCMVCKIKNIYCTALYRGLSWPLF